MIVEKLNHASIEEIKKGYTFEDGTYHCLVCGKQFEKGLVYTDEGIFYEAERFMLLHIQKEHGTVFLNLLQLDKRLTGLSEHQCSLLQAFYEGKSDDVIREELGIGSGSTIRAHRFSLREKERQAKLFLVLMELLNENKKAADMLVKKPKTHAKRPHKEENMIEHFFINGKLKSFDMKDKNKKLILEELVKKFEPGRIYTEKEVNAILLTVYNDFFVLRRYLVDFGFMERKTDGSAYWRKQSDSEIKEMEITEDMEKDRRKELKQQFKELKTVGGVYQIRNTVNGKIFIAATPNLKSVHEPQLALDRAAFRNKRFRDDLEQFGAEAFNLEILEKQEEEDDYLFDMNDEIKRLEKKWLEKLQPYGDKGYN